MIGDKKTPRIVLQNAYRMAVKELMVAIFHANRATAEETVSGWWADLAKTSAIKSGIFLHADPIQTAADLNHSKERKLTEEEQTAYHRILRQSLDSARRERYGEAELAARKPPQSPQRSQSQRTIRRILAARS